ncbi:putative ABC transporter ATP-binding protein YxlF [compost metagenome]
MYSIVVDGVSKRYRHKTVLDDISFKVEKGVILGVLGPNGAGKTTLLRTLSGLVQPSEGIVHILGHDPWRERKQLAGKVGILLDAAFLKHLSGRMNLSILGRLGKIPQSEQNQLLEYVGLDKDANKKVSTYSFGMTQRLGLAQALMGNPDILMLDEPLVGLDPSGIDEIKQYILDSARKGVTVIFSNHQLLDAGDICDEVIVINKGKCDFTGNVKDLTRTRGYSFVIDEHKDTSAITAHYGDKMEVYANRLTISLDHDEELADVIAFLVHHDYRIHHVEPVQNSLHSLFVDQMAKERS